MQWMQIWIVTYVQLVFFYNFHTAIKVGLKFTQKWQELVMVYNELTVGFSLYIYTLPPGIMGSRRQYVLGGRRRDRAGNMHMGVWSGCDILQVRPGFVGVILDRIYWLVSTHITRTWRTFPDIYVDAHVHTHTHTHLLSTTNHIYICTYYVYVHIMIR